MSVDEDFETALRQQFRRQEPQVGPAPYLTSRVLAEGHREARKRRTRLAVGACAGALTLVAGVSVAALQMAAGPENERGLTTSEREIDLPAETQPLAEWAATLPRGASPEVAYVAGTTVHLPGGAVTELDGTDAEVIGQSVAGLIVFVEDYDQGSLRDTRFVLIRDDGTTFDMDTGPYSAGSAMPLAVGTDSPVALVSPDGRYFTDSEQVIDKSTGTAVGRMPDHAAILVSWTSRGIIYRTGISRNYLWRLGEEPIRLTGRPGVYAVGTDVGMREDRRDPAGCAEVVRIDSAGEVTPIAPGCVPNLMSVSPDGTRGITADLQVIDLGTMETSPLSDTALASGSRYTDVHWLSADEFLVSVPASNDGPSPSARLVRCDTTALRCETATGAFDVGDNGAVDLP